MYPSELDVEKKKREKKVEKKDSSVILPEIPIGDGINLSKAKKEKKKESSFGSSTTIKGGEPGPKRICCFLFFYFFFYAFSPLFRFCSSV